MKIKEIQNALKPEGNLESDDPSSPASEQLLGALQEISSKEHTALEEILKGV